MAKDKADLLQGTLDMLILKSLSLGELHGYGIIQRLRQLSDEMLNVEQGSLYPALYRIEQKGWVSARWDVHETGREAKFYKLTRAGTKATRDTGSELGSTRARDRESQTSHIRSSHKKAHKAQNDKTKILKRYY